MIFLNVLHYHYIALYTHTDTCTHTGRGERESESAGGGGKSVSEFLDSQGHIEKPCLENHQQTNRTKTTLWGYKYNAVDLPTSVCVGGGWKGSLGQSTFQFLLSKLSWGFMIPISYLCTKQITVAL